MKMRQILLGTAVVAMSQQAAAQDKGTVSIELPVLSHSTTERKEKPDEGDDVKKKTTEMETADLDAAVIYASFGKFNVYLAPFADGEEVALGYMVTDDVEVGLNLGMNTEKYSEGDAETDTASNTYGLFATHYGKFGGIGTESSLGLQQVTLKTSAKDENGDDIDDEKKNYSFMGYGLKVLVVVPLASNIHYLGGLAYEMASGEEKEGKMDIDITDLTVHLATLRYTLD